MKYDKNMGKRPHLEIGRGFKSERLRASTLGVLCECCAAAYFFYLLTSFVSRSFDSSSHLLKSAFGSFHNDLRSHGISLVHSFVNRTNGSLLEWLRPETNIKMAILLIKGRRS